MANDTSEEENALNDESEDEILARLILSGS